MFLEIINKSRYIKLTRYHVYSYYHYNDHIFHLSDLGVGVLVNTTFHLLREKSTPKIL